MATRAPSTNVVRLPTAARRQVKQSWNAATRAARKALRDESPWPGEYIFSTEREAMRTVHALQELQRTPALQILRAMYGLLDPVDKAKILDAIEPRVMEPRDSAAQAIAFLKTVSPTYGELNDLKNAMRRLEGDA